MCSFLPSLLNGVGCKMGSDGLVAQPLDPPIALQGIAIPIEPLFFRYRRGVTPRGPKDQQKFEISSEIENFERECNFRASLFLMGKSRRRD